MSEDLSLEETIEARIKEEGIDISDNEKRQAVHDNGDTHILPESAVEAMFSMTPSMREVYTRARSKAVAWYRMKFNGEENTPGYVDLGNSLLADLSGLEQMRKRTSGRQSRQGYDTGKITKSIQDLTRNAVKADMDRKQRGMQPRNSTPNPGPHRRPNEPYKG